MEISVNPRAPFPTVLSFDGRVLEFYFGEEKTGSIRWHVTHITDVQFGVDKKGRQALEIKTKSGRPLWMEVARRRWARSKAWWPRCNRPGRPERLAGAHAG
jgi:hypothetical protein